MHSRRTFIKQTAGTVLFAFVFSPFKRLIASTTEEKIPTWAELVEIARWCPSVHNLQPHKIKVISETDAELHYDPARLLPVGDPGSVFATVAIGIFTEHLSVAANPFGKKVEMTEVFEPISATSAKTTLFAKLKLTNSDVKEELSPELITKRRTSRLHFSGDPLKPETLEKIKNQSEKFEHELFSSSNKEFTEYIIDLNQETLFEDLSSKENCKELDHLFRYTDEEAASKKDGLWDRCMGFSGSLMRSVFQHPDKWHKGLRKNMLAGHYKRSFKGTNTICWIGGKISNTSEWLTAGRMLARNWLLLTKDGAYIQPFGSLITNAGAYKKINEKFAQPKEGKKIWMIFRAGYSKEPARSYRLSTGEIIIK